MTSMMCYGISFRTKRTTEQESGPVLGRWTPARSSAERRPRCGPCALFHSGLAVFATALFRGQSSATAGFSCHTGA